MHQPVRAVLFDYGLVLTGPPNAAAWERMRSALALTPDALHHEYWVRRRDYDRGALTGEAYWREIAAATGKATLPPEVLDSLLEADLDLWTDINEPMLAWAQDLQRRGIRTGILSNLGDHIQAALVEKFSWLDGFHHRTWSHTLGIAKPDLDIYRHAAEGLGTPLSGILFIDDREDNIAAAQEAGMQAVRYTDWIEFEAAMRAAGYDHLLQCPDPAMAPGSSLHMASGARR